MQLHVRSFAGEAIKTCWWDGFGMRLMHISIDHHCKWRKAGWFPRRGNILTSFSESRSSHALTCFFDGLHACSTLTACKQSKYVWRNHFGKFFLHFTWNSMASTHHFLHLYQVLLHFPLTFHLHLKSSVKAIHGWLYSSFSEFTLQVHELSHYEENTQT